MEREQQERTVDLCPWCDSEIVWDEEIGPEEHCPHCSNELGGYRTLSLGDQDSDTGQEEEAIGIRDKQPASHHEADADWEEEAGDDTGWAGAGRSQSWLRADEKVQRILDDQEEMPECPSCREFMLHGGTSLLGAGAFEPAVPPSLKKALLPAAVKLQLYVCPSCHEVSTKLDFASRSHMAEVLDQED